MSHKHLTLCYLTKKTNAIASIAAILRASFPKITASQAASLEDAPTTKALDVIIADPEYKNISVSCPVLHVIEESSANAESSPNFITAGELGTFALNRTVRALLDIKKLSDELKETAIKDEQTGLYNHKFITEIAGREIKKAVRYNYPLSAVYIGIDGLKKINGKFGPEAGDRVITDFGLILKNCVREVDTVGRFYGDEFLAILPETNAINSFKVCSRIQNAVKNFAFINGEATVTASIGIATFSSSIRTAEDFLNSARTALAGAKKHGPGSICNFEDAKLIEEPARENRGLIAAVRQQILKLTEESKKSHFDGILKLFKDLPNHHRFFTHSEHVAFYSERLAEKLGLAKDDISTIRNSAVLHDIGKLAIDERILMKNGALTSTEYAIIKQHPVFAAQMLSEAAFIKNEVNIILHHHEHYDGNGYPDHMQGSHIPLNSRIIGLVEAWDAMITPQPYRDSLQFDAALSELKKCSGRQFDPELVEIFTGLIEN